MAVARFKCGSATENLIQLIQVIEDPKCSEIRLFVSRRASDPTFDPHSDGPVTNPPLLAAIARCDVPVFGSVYILFDGNFLNAARSPRAREVQTLLGVVDAHAGKATMGKAQIEFTSRLSPEEAVSKLQIETSGPYSRNQFFKLLSGFVERDYPF